MAALLLKVDHVSLLDHPEPQRRILAVHGKYGRDGEWRHTHEQAIEYIEKRMFSYYVNQDTRAVRLVVGRTPTGGKFLKSELDADEPRLLLNISKALPVSGGPAQAA